jgi:TP901 family phage tail tape measure protein
MARTSATISVGADTRQLERDIQKALGRDFKFKGLNEKAFTQPLGRITGAANEFQKSLDASNARVIAFGASAGLIYTVERAFSALVKSTIDVQKSLTDINVILNVSNKTLQNFGGQLFDIAKNTAQSFDTVAQAATEFSRQGLGLEETLKRTRDALVLTRLSGLDTVSAVEALTATINSFSNAALDSTTIINKLANVDAAFAVSSADLAEAIKRVGSSAQDVGVDFDQLLAIVTSVQQTTARGGSVIGNSLKTIFTRIQRTDTLDQLERLGIEVRTLEGNTLPAITILSNLASTFNTLSDSQRAQVAETVGGVFQINILRAALGDLQKEYSVYNNALRTASGATDEAIQRNEALNQTLSALINKTFVNLTKVGSDIGRISFQPTFENLLNTLNKGLESLDVEAQTAGGKIARGILEGIGAFISGPGVILATAVIGKLVINLAKFASQSLQTLLNLNTQAEQRAQIQTRINQVLAQEPALVAAVYNKQISVLDVENKILNIIRQQTLERERAAAISTTIAGGLLGKGVTTKGGTLRTKSSGFIPNFAMGEIFGALAGGYNPGNIRRMNIPGEGPVIYNSAEKVKKFPGLSQPAIMPPGQSTAGKNYKDAFGSIYGFNPYAFDGFIPNFAPLTPQRVTSITNEILKGNKPNLTNYTKAQRDQIATALKQKRQGQLLGGTVEYNASKLGVVGVTGGRGPFNPSTTFAQLGYPNDPRSVRFTGIQGRTIDDLRNNALSQKGEFSRSINSLFANPLTQLASTIFGKVNPDKKFLSLLQSSGRGNINLFPPGTEGSIFEAAVNLATKKGTGALEKAFNQDLAQKPFDFEEYGSPSQQFNKTFGFFPFVTKADAKRTVDTNSAREIIQKAYQVGSGVAGLPKPVTRKLASQGFIPNFAALSESIDRELAAGVSPSKIRIGRDKRLTSAYNPLGLGIYNTKDEPLGLSQGVSRYSGSRAKSAGASDGFIPNFVLPAIAAGGASILGSQLVRSVLSIAIYTLIDKVGQRIVDSIEDERGKAIAQAGVGALSFGASAAAFGGGKKAFLSSTAIGLGYGLTGAFDTLTKTQKEAIVEAEKNKDILEQFSSQLSNYNIALEKLESSTLNSADRAKVLAESNESLSKILEVAPDEYRKNLISAIEGGNIQNIRDELARLQTVIQAQTANSESLAKIIAISSDQTISKEEIKGLTSALLGFRTKTGETLRATFLADPSRGEAFAKSISKAFDEFSLARLRAEQQRQGLPDEVPVRYTRAGEIEISNLGNRVYSEDELVAIEDYKSSLQSLADKLVKSLRTQGIETEEARNIVNTLVTTDFEQLRQFLTGPLTQSILGLKVNTDNLAKGQKEAALITKDYILRLAKQAGDVSASSDNLEKFKGALSVENLTRYGKEVLNANEQLNANRISAEKVLALQEGLRTQILNETEQRGAEAKYIQRVNELLVKTGGDLDKFSKALEGSEQEIILESQRRRGLIFAEDFRGGRQAARESRILGGDVRGQDFGTAFFDEFDYKREDAFREAQLGAKETARTIKTEFNAAFFDFAQGATTAGEAFTRFANNVANKVQQLALEFSTNLIFGQLFGSTSAFGGIGGFGGLFKSNGGLIKGYSSGGKVNGGTGTRDDVPAMLTDGEYVIKKSSVNKYGTGFLEMLNGGRIGKYQFGGEGSFNKSNYFQYTGPAGYPTGGQYVVDPMLNLSALLDENNPQNRIRQQRQETLFAYLQYVEGVNTRNMEALAENQRINQEIQDQYNAQQNSLGAYASFGLGLAGAGLGFLKDGGHIKGFARGGQSTDNIPAMLMGGEFVMRKEAVNLYGKRFFDDLNRGRISKFANGGVVGNSNSTGVSTNNYNPTNNVNVTVNLNQQMEKTSENNTATGERPQDEEVRRNRQLADQIKTQVIRVITEQQRPGGLLGSNIYKKQG